MSGGFTQARGASTGPAPNTSFFAPAPDALSLLSPYHENNSNNPGSIVTGYGPARLIGTTWTPNNLSYQGGSNTATCSLTAAPSVTAPDGSTNTYHLTEAGGASMIHYCTAGHSGAGLSRYAAFVKAAERTRCGIEIYSPNTGGGGYGVRTIVDLAGQRIAVAPYVTNQPGGGFAPFTAGAVHITPWPNGWCMVSLEWIPGRTADSPQSTIMKIMTDSGSGLVTESTSYSGDGASGIYVWQATALPVAAWSLSGITQFFDDFNSSSTFDSTASGAAGFNWYPFNTAWTGPGFNTAIYPPSQGTHSYLAGVVFSSSTLIENGANVGLNQLQYIPMVCQAWADGTGQYYPHGFVTGPNNIYQPPIWITARLKQWTADQTAGEFGIFAISLENMTTQPNGVNFAKADNPHRCEIDYFSAMSANDFHPAIGEISVYLPGDFSAQGNISLGTWGVSPYWEKWVPTYTYPNGQVRAWNNTLYTSIQNLNINNQPDLSPAWWTNTGYPSYVGFAPVWDPSQYVVYDFIWLPYNSNVAVDPKGYVLTFSNGQFSGATSYTPYSQTFDGPVHNILDSAHWCNFMTGDYRVQASQTTDYFRMRK
jgi:hypothetical protein